jgi:hypothetical protein
MSISVFIPVYDPHSSFKEFLNQSLSSIKNQTLIPETVYLSGSALPNYLEELVQQFPSLSIEIHTNDSINAVENLNCIRRIVKAPFTKILFQDDVLLSPTLLEANLFTLNSGAEWVVSASRHVDTKLNALPREVEPVYSPRLSSGINSLGSPSAVSLRTDIIPSFERSLLYMYDCEWYLRFAHTHGLPSILKNQYVGIRIHKDQATNEARSLLPKEIEITKSLHDSSITKEVLRKLGFQHLQCSCQA